MTFHQEEKIYGSVGAVLGFIWHTIFWPYYIGKSILECFDLNKGGEVILNFFRALFSPLNGIFEGYEKGTEYHLDAVRANTAELEKQHWMRSYVREARTVADSKKEKMQYTDRTLTGHEIEKMYQEYQKNSPDKKGDKLMYCAFKKEAIRFSSDESAHATGELILEEYGVYKSLREKNGEPYVSLCAYAAFWKAKDPARIEEADRSNGQSFNKPGLGL